MPSKKSSSTETAAPSASSASSSRKRSRKRLENASEDVKVHENTTKADEEDVEAAGGDADFWKKKFYEMKQLRDEAESSLKKEKKLRESNNDILSEATRLVNDNISAPSNANSYTLDSNPKSSSEKSEDDNSSKTAENERLLKIIDFYESFTAVTVKVKDGNRYCCTIKNPGTRKFARFYISSSSTEGELLYEPSANVELFPEYMQEEALSFVPEMGPVLLGDAIASLFVENEEDNNNNDDDDDDDEQEKE